MMNEERNNIRERLMAIKDILYVFKNGAYDMSTQVELQQLIEELRILETQYQNYDSFDENQSMGSR